MSPMRETLTTALKGVRDLPTLPSVLDRLEAALRNGTASAEKIAKIISADPTLASNILRVVNCAYYAARAGTITSIRHAVARLGLREVRRICTVLTVIETFRGFGPHLDHKAFWRHSVMTAIGTRVIHGLSQGCLSFGEDEAYVAGLVHDIGILILDQYFPALYQRTRKEADDKSVPYAEAELRLLGMDHGEVGGVVLDRWRLSPAIVQAVSWHHQLSRCDERYRAVVSAVHLADSISTQSGTGDSTDESLSSVSESAWHNLDLSPEDIPAILENFRKEAGQCEFLLPF